MIIVPNLDSNEVSINWINDVKCKDSDLPLFFNNTIKYSDIIQGSIGSCWFFSNSYKLFTTI